MSKKKRRQEPRRAPSGQGTYFPRLAWRDAEARIEVMEESARRAIANKDDIATIVVPVAETPPPPILLPARIAGILYGPDGRPLNTEGA